jgi:hypothetical protein
MFNPGHGVQSFSGHNVAIALGHAALGHCALATSQVTSGYTQSKHLEQLQREDTLGSSAYTHQGIIPELLKGETSNWVMHGRPPFSYQDFGKSQTICKHSSSLCQITGRKIQGTRNTRNCTRAPMNEYVTPLNGIYGI